jgi:hypothetical protein
MLPLDIHYRVHKPLLWAWMKTANYWKFSWSKGHYSLKNGSIVPKTQLDPDILMINLYPNFISIFATWVQRKWTKTANYWNFSKSKGHNSVKNGSIKPKAEVDLDILMIDLYNKFHLNNVQPVQRKWTETANYWNFSKSKGHNCQKWLAHTQNIIWSRYSYDKSICQISFQYVQPVRGKWTETALDRQTDRTTNSSKAIHVCPPFYEGGHKNYQSKTKLKLDLHTPKSI